VWVSRHPLNNSLAVFIHGIWGSRWVTWRSHVDFFQRLPTERPELRSYDVYLFTYSTPCFGQEPPLRESIVHELRMFLEGVRARYDTVVLVCHSQGGLLAKMYILEELLNDRGATMNIDLVITLNTPHRGADWRNPFLLFGLAVAELLSRTPIIRRLYILRQLRDLNPWGGNIRFLENNWDTHISTVPGTAETNRRYIRSIAICGLKDWLVSMASAEGFYVDEKDATFNGHSVDSEQLASYVGHLLSGYDNPAPLKREFEEIYSDPDRLQLHVAECIQKASTIMNGMGIQPASFVSSRSQCFAREFRSAFARHPLRKLSLMDAFLRYVRKLLED
jgi:pimeloyl-ACP methyl ester carboxylesterase